MKIGVIIGSLRKKSESGRVGDYFIEMLKSQGTGTYKMDLGNSGIPIWDETFWDNVSKWENIWRPISNELKSCDGFVLISPEYGGMASPGLKNMMLLCNKQELSHKPGLIVTVSTSRGGAYPVAELRMSSYKNTQICYIPEHIIIRDVAQFLHKLEPGKEPEKADSYIRNRIDYAIPILLAYAEGLSLVRSKNLFNYKKYPFGM